MSRKIGCSFAAAVPANAAAAARTNVIAPHHANLIVDTLD
jgi:hypothetical protein